MSLKIASRLDPIKPSITLAVTAKAARLKADGVDVVSFGAGEPDFDTPDHIKDAARHALDRGVGKYTEVGGLLALRRAIAAEMSAVHRAKIDAENVLVSCGAKHSLYNLFMALLDEGDEVLIPAPYWVSYPDMVMLADGKPVILPTRAEDGFAVTAEQVAAACTPRTRAIVLNNPSNPTGTTYTRTQVEALAKVCLERDLIIVSDDIYRALVYGRAEYVSIASLSPELADHTVLVDGVSKTYAMTGWRIGYTSTTAALALLVKAMGKIQGQSTSNPTHIAQIATLAAITGPQECVELMRRAFNERRLEIVKLLRAIPEVSCPEPTGAFYAFPDVSAYVGRTTPEGRKLETDVELCDWLLDHGRVAVVPGSGFGAPGNVRLSYACAMDSIRDGVGRLGAALGQLRA